jgi:hypothetical protein
MRLLVSASTAFNRVLADSPENINDGTILLNKTDYGPFPNLESIHGPPIHEYLRLGPGLSVSVLTSFVLLPVH